MRALRSCLSAGSCLFVVTALLNVPLQAQFLAYVSDTNSNSVSVIDTSTNTVTATIPVGTNPYVVAITPDGKHAYVANFGSSSVSVIDTASNMVTATVPVGDAAFGVAISPNGARAYVTGANGTVSVIDTSTNTVTTTISGSGLGNSRGIAVTPDGTRVYVVNEVVPSSVSVIDTSTNSVIDTIYPGGTYPIGVAITPNGSTAYVSVGQNGGPFIAVIDTATNTVSTTVQVGVAPTLLAVNPSGTDLFVANMGSNFVSVVDTTNNSVSSIPIATGGSLGIAVTPDGSRVYITNTPGNGLQGGTSVSAIDVASNTVIATIPVGQYPTGIAIAPAPFPCHGSSTIASNFNGAPISSGDYIWFNSNFKVGNGLGGSTPAIVQFTGGTVQFTANNQNYQVNVPNSSITFSQSNSCASSSFGGGAWQVTVPMSGSDEVFLSGFAFPVPSGGLPGGIKNVTWSGTFNTNEPGLTMQWKWGAAVYSQFPDAAAPVIKPTHTAACAYPNNSDHAGTPENDKSFVVGGATGGGGSDWTGGWSGTASVPFTCR